MGQASPFNKGEAKRSKGRSKILNPEMEPRITRKTRMKSDLEAKFYQIFVNLRHLCNLWFNIFLSKMIAEPGTMLVGGVLGNFEC